MSETADGFQVRVDFDRILETISSRIYDNQFAFLRENVQNAIDAIRIQARRDGIPSGDSCYRIDVVATTAQISISDNGIGMTKEELADNFWTMGASGKNNAEARAAGCIGTFGIGGFANFGVCETLRVSSRTDKCSAGHSTSLSREAFGADRFALPTVFYAPAADRSDRGTTVTGIGKQPFDVAGLHEYLVQYVSHVQEAIFYNGVKLSQVAFRTASGGRELRRYERAQAGMDFVLRAEADSSLTAEVEGIVVAGGPTKCAGRVALLGNGVETFKRGFRLCSVNVASHFGASGWIDCDALRPTAGRDTLDSESVALLTSVLQTIETHAIEEVLKDSNLLASHVRLIPEIVRRGMLERLNKLRVDLVGGEPMTLGELRSSCEDGHRTYFSSSGTVNSASEAVTARGHHVVRLSGNQHRRRAEVKYLHQFCRAEEIDGLMDCLEAYADLDRFELSIMTELSYSIKRLFHPPEFRLIPGKLTLDAPIFWSGKREGAAVIVYVDTRHGELQKLKPLGYSSIFWSMIEAFCREYLTDTLRRQGPKLFGAGAMSLDELSRAKSELWELVIGDIEVSRLGADPSARGAARVEVMRKEDVSRVTISSAGVQSEPGVPPKILQIVDDSGMTGLGGYYLRIPESATAAFGEIIRKFPSFAVVWFANRVTWQGSDLDTTAFLFDVTLDRLVVDVGGSAAHGAVELAPSRLQTYSGQVYFYVPPEIQAHLVPRNPADLIRIQIRHELVDLNRARAWTSKGSG